MSARAEERLVSFFGTIREPVSAHGELDVRLDRKYRKVLTQVDKE